MEFIGIDFGSYKTVISSSKENGKIILDEQGKRNIPTVVELTTPIRKFGNAITGEHELTIDLRMRNFRDENNNIESFKVYYMFMNYIKRLLQQTTKGAPSLCISVPTTFKYVDRKFLLDIVKSCNMKVERIYNDISAIAMFACLRRENFGGKFAIIDFGHYKTEIGIFTYENKVLTPLYINGLKIGAKDFDNELIKLIQRKYKLEDKKIVRENILRKIENIKTVINSYETANVQIYINENPITVQITQEEFLILCKEHTAKISEFLDQAITENNFEGVIEVTGGNSSSFLIKKLLEDKYVVQSTLNLTESCAIGTSLGLACSVVAKSYKMNDIIGKNIFIKLESKNSKAVQVFNKISLVESKKNLTYKQKEGFKLSVYEEEDNIGTIEIKKEKTEEAEDVEVLVAINKYGILEVESVKVKQEDIEFTYSSFELSEDIKDQMKKEEEKYRDLEDNIQKIGHLRNELETTVMGLSGLSENLPDNFFTNEELDNIRNIAMDLFDIPAVSTLEEEQAVKEDVMKQLEFVTTKLKKLEEETKAEIEKMMIEINICKNKFTTKSASSYFKLHGLYYRLEEFIKRLNLDLFAASSFDKKLLDKLKIDFKESIVKAEAELVKIQLEEEDRKKREKEEKSKQEEDNKNEKDNTSKNENNGKASKNEDKDETSKNENNGKASKNEDKDETSKKNKKSSKCDKNVESQKGNSSGSDTNNN